MRPDRNLTLLAVALALTLSAGCRSAKVDDLDGNPEPTPRFASQKNDVKFKRNDRIRTDFANALSLSEDALCMELGLYSCTHQVHAIALGDVEPYDAGLYDPLPQTGVTTPIALERVALAGCAQRVDLDLANQSAAVVFRGVNRTPDGRLADGVDASPVGEALDVLYRRALQRRATDAEIAHLKSLYAEVEAGSSDAARDWAVLSCFAVLTTVESVFY